MTRSHNRQPIVIDGISYPSKTAAARSLNVSVSTISRRLARSGQNPMHLPVGVKLNQTPYLPITIDGLTYYSYFDIARTAQVHVDHAYYRIKYLCDHHLPVTLSAIQTTNHPRLNIELDRHLYHHWKDIAHDYHINIATLRKRYYNGQRGAALVEPTTHQIQSIELAGHHFASLRAAAAHFDIPYNTFYYRWRRFLRGRINEAALLKRVR